MEPRSPSEWNAHFTLPPNVVVAGLSEAELAVAAAAVFSQDATNTMLNNVAMISFVAVAMSPGEEGAGRRQTQSAFRTLDAQTCQRCNIPQWFRRAIPAPRGAHQAPHLLVLSPSCSLTRCSAPLRGEELRLHSWYQVRQLNGMNVLSGPVDAMQDWLVAACPLLLPRPHSRCRL